MEGEQNEKNDAKTMPYYRGAFNALKGNKMVDPADSKLYDAYVNSIIHGSLVVSGISGFWAYLFDLSGAYKSHFPKPIFYAASVVIPSVIFGFSQFKGLNQLANTMDKKYQEPYAKEFLSPIKELG